MHHSKLQIPRARVLILNMKFFKSLNLKKVYFLYLDVKSWKNRCRGLKRLRIDLKKKNKNFSIAAKNRLFLRKTSLCADFWVRKKLKFRKTFYNLELHYFFIWMYYFRISNKISGNSYKISLRYTRAGSGFRRRNNGLEFDWLRSRWKTSGNLKLL